MKRGFTLIELLVVIAIIAILAAILFPVFARAREKARQSNCLSNSKQIMLAILMYAQDYDETLCYGQHDDAGGARAWNLVVEPYVKNAQVFRCPSKPEQARGYGWNYNNMPYRTNNPSARAALGYWNRPAEVLVFACNRAGANNQYIYAYTSYPTRWPTGLPDPHNMGTLHNDGSNVGFLDGHAKWLAFNTFMGTDNNTRRLWGALND
ncbi:MAG TPA: hypothetical protein DGT21_25995 [Armatimonadetes bacterium]|jgi:prepilin-type N-terminal cleavage/methylation domain-containing protein/prepilin-type processing-associated H-X9-DG protein|nr:hypothetical protein [Armatimonadota bacterium]